MKKKLFILGALFTLLGSPCFAYHVVVSTSVPPARPHKIARELPPPKPMIMHHHKNRGITVVKYNPAGGIINTFEYRHGIPYRRIGNRLVKVYF